MLPSVNRNRKRARKVSRRKLGDSEKKWPRQPGPAGNSMRTLQKAVTLKNSEMITYSRVMKERSYCVWHSTGRREAQGRHVK